MGVVVFLRGATIARDLVYCNSGHALRSLLQEHATSGTFVFEVCLVEYHPLTKLFFFPTRLSSDLFRACGPRNLMKMPSSWGSIGSERRGRYHSGQVEAVYLSDPERA